MSIADETWTWDEMHDDGRVMDGERVVAEVYRSKEGRAIAALPALLRVLGEIERNETFHVAGSGQPHRTLAGRIAYEALREAGVEDA